MDKETILIVEDNPDVRNILVGYVTDLNFDVLEAEDGNEAVRKAKSFTGKISLIIMDLNMPEAPGPAAIKFFKNQDAFRKVPILVVTAHDPMPGIGAGANAFIHKPIVSLKEFNAKVKGLISKSKSHD